MRDSNPRTREGQRFSRPPQSTTLPTLRCKDTKKINFPKKKSKNEGASNYLQPVKVDETANIRMLIK